MDWEGFLTFPQHPASTPDCFMGHCSTWHGINSSKYPSIPVPSQDHIPVYKHTTSYQFFLEVIWQELSQVLVYPGVLYLALELLLSIQSHYRSELSDCMCGCSYAPSWDTQMKTEIGEKQLKSFIQFLSLSVIMLGYALKASPGRHLMYRYRWLWSSCGSRSSVPSLSELTISTLPKVCEDVFA